MSELFDIVAAFGFTSHAYADNTQLYISVPAVSYTRKQLNASSAALNGFATEWLAIG